MLKLIYHNNNHEVPLSLSCKQCPQNCVIPENGFGLCGIRENLNDTLVSREDFKVSIIRINEIESKPFFHFFPGAICVSVGSYGCNMRCKWCIARETLWPEKGKPWKRKVKNPEDIPALAKKGGYDILTLGFNEPSVSTTLTLKLLTEAKKNGLFTGVKSNGYFSAAFFEKIAPLTDAFSIDLKGGTNDFYRKYCAARLAPVVENLKRVKEAGIALEVVTLDTPVLPEEDFFRISDIIAGIGMDVPWHVTGFEEAPEGVSLGKTVRGEKTPLEHRRTLRPGTPETARAAASRVGLNYLYIHGKERRNWHTFCPTCKKIVIDRTEKPISVLEKGKCPGCGAKIPGIF